MDDKEKINEKLLEIVKHRYVHVVVNKQDWSYKRNKKLTGNISFENYSAVSDE